MYLVYGFLALFLNSIVVYTTRLSMMWSLVMTFFMVAVIAIIMINPFQKKMNQNVADAKSDLEKYGDKTDDFNKQLKLTLENAITGRNSYYIMMFMVLLYMPIVCYVVYLISVPPPIPSAEFLSMIMPYTVLIVFATYGVAVGVWLMYSWVWVLLGVIFLTLVVLLLVR